MRKLAIELGDQIFSRKRTLYLLSYLLIINASPIVGENVTFCGHDNKKGHSIDTRHQDNIFVQ